MPIKHAASRRARPSPAIRPLALASPLQALARIGAVLALWESRARDRRKLAEMPETLLKDIGLSRADALAESEKPFWRP